MKRRSRAYVFFADYGEYFVPFIAAALTFGLFVFIGLVVLHG